MEKFILRANEKHNNRYDYSNTKYVNAKTKTTIICPDHGKFTQTPDSHLHSNGCQECSKINSGLSRRLSPQEFINKAVDVHGDTYDYSHTKYEKNDTSITIRCLIHGEFTQTPNNHLSGKGCTPCGVQKMANKQRKTLEQFMEEAHSKHGDKFNYSKVVYINTHTNIEIICPIHGVVEQTPIDHISSLFGCRQCASTEMGYLCRSNTHEFIKKAKEIHDETYDYTEVKYETNTTYVTIVCKVHGKFSQLPAVHLRGNGCRLCGIQKQADSKRYTNEEFIEKARDVHGDLYNYDNVDYVTSHIKIIITCKTHGEFPQTPNSHLSGKGCPDCANERIANGLKQTPEQFIKQAQEIHDNIYGYSKVKYINSKTLVTITCPTHGDFEQTPGGHLCGGCKQCANVYIGQCRRKSQEKFIEEVLLTHNNKYTYDKVVYVNSTTDIIITCPYHGDFTQKPVNHWCGKGCAKCIGRVSKISLEWFNMFMVNHPKLIFEYRISTTKFVADGYDPETNTIYEFHGDYWHGNPTIYKSDIYNSTTKCTMGDLYQKTQKKKKQCIKCKKC